MNKICLKSVKFKILLWTNKLNGNVKQKKWKKARKGKF